MGLRYNKALLSLVELVIISMLTTNCVAFNNQQFATNRFLGRIDNEWLCHDRKCYGYHCLGRNQMCNGNVFSSMLSMSSTDNNKEDDDFWASQKALATAMSDNAEKSLRQEQMEKYEERQVALIGDAVYFTFLIFCGVWILFDNPFFSYSYIFGATFGIAYLYGLGKYVATLGGTVDDAQEVQGAGVGQARFAFLILLFILVGKLRTYGLIEIPAIAGFFTYQLASLSQGLREIND